MFSGTIFIFKQFVKFFGNRSPTAYTFLLSLKPYKLLFLGYRNATYAVQFNLDKDFWLTFIYFYTVMIKCFYLKWTVSDSEVSFWTWGKHKSIYLCQIGKNSPVFACFSFKLEILPQAFLSLHEQVYQRFYSFSLLRNDKSIWKTFKAKIMDVQMVRRKCHNFSYKVSKKFESNY